MRISGREVYDWESSLEKYVEFVQYHTTETAP